jgi:hypothetical protein
MGARWLAEAEAHAEQMTRPGPDGEQPWLQRSILVRELIEWMYFPARERWGRGAT